MISRHAVSRSLQREHANAGGSRFWRRGLIPRLFFKLVASAIGVVVCGGLCASPPLVPVDDANVMAASHPASRRIGSPMGPIPLFTASERARLDARAPIREDLRAAAASAARPAAMATSAEEDEAQVPEELVAFLERHEIRRGDPDSGYIGLTFDCGYGPEPTRSILRALARHGVRATFFLEGGFARAYPELVVRIAAGGHELANHSATHPDFTNLDEDAIAAELESAHDLIVGALDEFNVVNQSITHYFRFPFGARDETRLHEVADSGYQSVFWTLDPKGWQAGSTSRAVAAYVGQRMQAGDIIIQHCNSWADALAVPEIVRLAAQRGLNLGTVSDVVHDSDLPDASSSAPQGRAGRVATTLGLRQEATPKVASDPRKSEIRGIASGQSPAGVLAVTGSR